MSGRRRQLEPNYENTIAAGEHEHSLEIGHENPLFRVLYINRSDICSVLVMESRVLPPHTPSHENQWPISELRFSSREQ